MISHACLYPKIGYSALVTILIDSNREIYFTDHIDSFRADVSVVDYAMPQEASVRLELWPFH